MVKGVEDLPPMFTFGLGSIELGNIKLPPIGFIFIREDFYKWSLNEHLQVYLAHEIGHIVKWHPLANPFKLGRLFLQTVLESEAYEVVESIWNVVKMVEYVITQKRPLEEEISQLQELEADKFAFEVIGDKNLVISALKRLNEIIPDGLSHFTEAGIKIPILSVKERIDAVQGLEVG